jgi:hypothetical protein
MGNSRAGAGGGTTLRDNRQRSDATPGPSGGGSGAIRTMRGWRRKPRLSPEARKARRRRRVRRFLMTSAIISAGLVAGLIGGIISGIA